MPKLQIDRVEGRQHAIGIGINGDLIISMFGCDPPCTLHAGVLLTLTCDESVWFERTESRVGTRLEQVWVEDPRTRRGHYETRQVQYTYYIQVQYEDKRNIFTRTYTVCANADLASGENKFPFQIPLTNDMPPSFNIAFNKAKGGVTYSLKGQFLNPMNGEPISSFDENVEVINSIHKTDFIQKLDAPVDLGSASLDVAACKCCGCFCCKNDERKIKLNISACPQYVFVPKSQIGDMPKMKVTCADKYNVVAAPSPNRGITVGVRIDNQSDDPINHFQLQIDQILELKVKGVSYFENFLVRNLDIRLDENEVVPAGKDRTVLIVVPLPHNINSGKGSEWESYFPSYMSKFIEVSTNFKISFPSIKETDGFISTKDAFYFVSAIDEGEYRKWNLNY